MPEDSGRSIDDFDPEGDFDEDLSDQKPSTEPDRDPEKTGELEFVVGSEKGDTSNSAAQDDSQSEPGTEVSVPEPEANAPPKVKVGKPKSDSRQPAVKKPVVATPVGKPKQQLESIEKLDFNLPNGSEGKSYNAEIKIEYPASWRKNWPADLTLSDIDFQLHGLEECGIEIDRGDHALELNGTPNTNGDIAITCTYQLPGAEDGSRPAIDQETKINWVVNPDPRSLWKNLEPDADLPYQKQHTEIERVVGPCAMIAASVRGRSHAHEGTFRDDEFCIHYDADSDWYLMAVSDGAGSAKYSRRGSQIACDTVRDEVLPHFLNSLSSADFEQLLNKHKNDPQEQSRSLIRRTLYGAMGGPAMKAFKAIQDEVKKVDDAELKHFAATLIFTISKKFDFGWFVGSFCIGDGGAAIYSSNSDVRTLNHPDGGEFAGQTRFITMSEIWGSGQEVLDRIEFEIVDDLTAIIAMTDGVTDPKFQTDKNFFDTKYWHELWLDIGNEVELSKINESADAELLKWLDFWSTGNHDDRTIALLLP